MELTACLVAAAATAFGRTLECKAGAAVQVLASCRWEVYLLPRENHLGSRAQVISGTQSDTSCWSLPRHWQQGNWEKQIQYLKWLENKGSHDVRLGNSWQRNFRISLWTYIF